MYDSRKVGFSLEKCKTGYDFEVWVQQLLICCKFKAELTNGNDNGVDIIATKQVDGVKYKFYIQCKFHNRIVGKAPIQEVYTGYKYFGGDGHPVVITNNHMTTEAKAFANKMAVEVITEYQLNELRFLSRSKKLVNDKHTGLLGLMLSSLTNDYELGQNAVKIYDKSCKEIEEVTDKEQLKNELINSFNEADILLQESAELQMKATLCQQKTLALQKEALLRNLNCP